MAEKASKNLALTTLEKHLPAVKTWLHVAEVVLNGIRTTLDSILEVLKGGMNG